MSPARSIVYFAYLGEDGTDAELSRRRLSFMDGQMRWLAALVGGSGQRIEVFVAYVAPRDRDDDVHRLVAGHGFRVDPGSISDNRRNRFEYPGFRAMKALAGRSHPEALIYYCHSKGIVELAAHKMGIFRLHTRIGLTADLGLLAEDPGVTRAGLFPSRFGWCWYNFFWIKAGYMAGLSVEEAADRYHYEALIGRRGDKQAYRGVLPLIGHLPFARSGIAVQPWYRADETTSPALLATYGRYAEMRSPVDPRA
jgi:uncharacterized protein YfiM (DUF2279 family)